MQKQTFEGWLEQLRQSMVKNGIATEFIALSRDCWKWFYESDYTPEQALAGDLREI